MPDADQRDSPYDIGLERREANTVPLSPISFLVRAALVYPDHPAVIYGDRRITYRSFHDRCVKLGTALAMHGVTIGDTVSVLAPNIPEMLECHYAIPMTGAVMNSINTRLDARTIAFILDHAQSKALIMDRAFAPVVKEALAETDHRVNIIEIDDPAEPGAAISGVDYEAFLARGTTEFPPAMPRSENDPLALNYTSGTTGNPKGVVSDHRGAYLNALAGALATRISHDSVYLWTLPMFHCNGWCFTWAVTAVGGTHVCLRKVEPDPIFHAIAEHRVTTFCGAPVVLTMLLHAPDEARRAFDHRCAVFTGGAAPPSTVISGMESLGFSVLQLYGLTETYGPSLMCAWQDDWADLPLDQRATFMARQGVPYPLLEEAMVADPDTLAPVPSDGRSMGEIMLRGNTVMRGYLKNDAATEDAFAGGWFHTGDLAVRHPDGYIEVKDRSKDVIISGGENISSLEVEEVLYKHPDVMEAAVVARPHPKWGETPCAFVTLKPKAGTVTEADIIAFCRNHMAHYKAPKTVLLGPLPKTSTGKIQKFVLRERAEALDEESR